MPSYAETVDWLQRLEVTGGWDLKLERMRAALAACGDPQDRFPAVHLAGTNGKGSTAAMIESVLRAAGHRTGLYTSPHLVDFAERIRAGGRTIPHDVVASLVAELRTRLDARGITLTHFEFSTLLALEWFARIAIDVAVVEVGLGGRLDATNMVRPAVTAVTSIAHDHEEWLGSELGQIAFEKAGIAKAGIPLALGRVPPDAEAVIASHAAEVGAPLWRAGVEGRLDGAVFRGPDKTCWDGLSVGLEGAFQHANAEVALLVLALLGGRFAVDGRAVRTGLGTVCWPGRLAVLGTAPLLLVDGAHNPAGVAALAAELPAVVRDRRLVLVFAVMADKAWGAMLEHLLPLAAEVVVTRVGRRGLDPDRLAAAVGGDIPVRAVHDPRAAVRFALERATPDAAVVVTGSLFLAGEAYAAVAPGAMLFEPWHGWGD
jgi:dihydrofolate synthase/folylpolyglutamate synthase